MIKQILSWVPVIGGLAVAIFAIGLVWVQGFGIDLTGHGLIALALGLGASIVLVVVFLRLMYISNANGQDERGTNQVKPTSTPPESDP